ncbi:MAG: bifunctional precorrin-2 dehydrogenase/sirohydrochlorin ferrochelatase, partial [Phycisphaerae bacterium]
MADIYPIFLYLIDRPVLLVGAGAVALRKATGLVAAGAQVTVVAPPPAHPDFAGLGSHNYEPIAYYSGMMLRHPRWSLVFAATDRPEVNARVLADARAQGIFCTRCDQPETGDFSNPALLQRPGVTVAVSTHGASPVLAVRLRESIAAQLDPVLLELSEALARWR